MSTQSRPSNSLSVPAQRRASLAVNQRDSSLKVERHQNHVGNIQV